MIRELIRFVRLAAFLLGGLGLIASAAPLQTRHVFLITADGLRWEEVFNGAEWTLMNKTNGNVADTNALLRDFWRETPEARRAALMPFVWGTMAARGQLWGNRAKGSSVRVANGHNFSYPGYNELLTGAADRAIDSNDKNLNANTNVFEWLNTRPAFTNRVAAAVNWCVIPWLLNAPRARIPVWSGFEMPPGSVAAPTPPAAAELLARTTPLWTDVGLDTFTAAVVREIVRQKQPRALYVSYGETDDWAHEGRYDRYLRAARNFDACVEEVWNLAQSLPEYRGRTTLILSTDHGRGPAPVAWKGHGRAIPESAYIWLGVIGPDTPSRGKRSDTRVMTEGQIAATVAALLGEDFRAANPRATEPIQEFLR